MTSTPSSSGLRANGARAARAIAFCVSVAACWWAPASALAQSRAAETAMARESFRQGLEAARAEQWDRAVELFRRSHELAPRPVTMMNLPGALTQAGRLVEAAEAYRSFLREARSDRSVARLQDEAREHLGALEERIPRVRLTWVALRDDDVVRIDDYEMARAALDIPVPVDPGAHQIVVHRGEASRATPFRIEEGRSLELRIDLSAEAWPEGAIEIPPRVVDSDAFRIDPREQPRTIADEPAFWIVLGAVVAGGIAAGVTIGVLTQPQTAPIYSGNIAPTGLAL